MLGDPITVELDEYTDNGGGSYILENASVGGVKFAVYRATPFVILTSSMYPFEGSDLKPSSP